jgi:lysozyme family protein
LTLSAARAAKTASAVNSVCAIRLSFMRGLKKLWPVFGTGWGRRVAGVRAMALAMCEAA